MRPVQERERPSLSRIAQLEQELKEARNQIARIDADRRAAETLAAERLTNLTDLRQALKIIEATP